MSLASMTSAEADVCASDNVQLKSNGPKPAPRRGSPVGKLSHAELLILGCGPAGYSAAVHAARANLRPLLVTGVARDEASKVDTAPDGWPTDVDMIQGSDLKRRLRDHAERASTRVAFDPINWVNLARRPFHVQGASGHYTCDALIVAVDRPLAAALFQGQLEMKNGHIVTYTGLSGMATLTSLQGVFVVGDALDPALDQVITSTGTACMAVLDAQRFLGH
jgi:thioredoxin reductase